MAKAKRTTINKGLIGNEHLKAPSVILAENVLNKAKELETKRLDSGDWHYVDTLKGKKLVRK